MTEPCDLSAVEARRLIGNKKLSPVELLESCLKRIEKVNPTLNAIVAMDEKAAKDAAKAAEEAVMRGDDLGLLHGLPIGIKDLQATAGLRTTWGSLIYKDHVPEKDEATVANLRDQGAVILAKTNTPEFGAGANTKNRVYGATGNPFDPNKTCAGSSGGSAVALATGMLPLATGSDYGGSLRTPAAFCGVSGFRPSPGVVPGPERSSAFTPFSVNGPMARSIADLHLLLKAQIDLDKQDPFSSDDALRIPEELPQLDLGSLRVAISTDLGCAPVDKDIRRIFQERVSTFRHVFAETQDRDPDLGPVHDVFEILRGVYFVGAHRERLEKHRDLLGPNVIDNTERGLKWTAADIAWANVEQSKIYRRFLDFFDDADVLICPAASVTPFPHSELSVTEINGEKMPTYMRWLAITYALTTAVPSAAVIPCGVDHVGMPFGIQVVGPNGSDALVLAVANALERVLAENPATSRPVPDIAALTG
ncbi:MAG TPA: amidase family protein [Hyphomicrobiaceae bacterium]|jgi:Asp-tRNA(Asn)/Glu-tRNA(Gln) amidotransferase A subunit family amidase